LFLDLSFVFLSITSQSEMRCIVVIVAKSRVLSGKKDFINVITNKSVDSCFCIVKYLDQS